MLTNNRESNTVQGCTINPVKEMVNLKGMETFVITFFFFILTILQMAPFKLISFELMQLIQFLI